MCVCVYMCVYVCVCVCVCVQIYVCVCVCVYTLHAADIQGGSSERFQGHPQMYYLPQEEGVLLHVFDNRSRVCG